MKCSALALIFILFLLGCAQKPSSTTTPTKAATDSTVAIPASSSSTPPYAGPRYILVQSTITAKGTYKLDTYTGKVYQLQEDRSKTDQWVKLKRVPLLPGMDSTVEGRPNYHLFLSTIAMRFTYLINTNTGDTWELVEDPHTREDFFSPIADE